jgi:hypothetical protein
MSEPIRDGGTAFPAEYERRLSMPANPTMGQLYPTSEHVSNPGMSLRDYFAAQALANPTICTGRCEDWELRAWFKDRGGITKHEIATKQAFSYADAMLAERAK